jgi:AraC-like DNA-binding protein
MLIGIKVSAAKPVRVSSMEEPQSPPLFTASSSEIGGAAALELFQGSVRDVFEVRLPDGVTPDQFRFDMKAVHLGRLLVSEIHASGLIFERGRDMVASAGIDHILVQLYTEGGYTGVIGGVDAEVRAGDICILDMTGTLRTQAMDFGNITLVVPRPLLNEAMADTGVLHGLILQRESPLTGILAAHLRALVAGAGALPSSDADLIARGTVALIARLLEGEAARSEASASPATSLRGMLDYIDAHLHEPDLGPGRLIERFGVSRAKLYRKFDGVGGVSEVIRLRRLTGAAMDLASLRGPKVRVSEVARRWGFADDSSFGRAFRAHYGITPREARTRSDEVWHRIRHTAQSKDDDGSEIARWLRTLRR